MKRTLTWSNRSKAALVCIVLLLLALLPLVSAYIDRVSSTALLPPKYTGLKIAEQSASFLRLSRADATPGFSILTCNGHCDTSDSPTYPNYAWNMLAFSSLYSQTKKENYLTDVRNNFNALRQKLRPMKSGYDLIVGLAEGYKVTKDSSLLLYLYDYAAAALVLAQRQPYNESAHNVAMMAAARSRELSLVADLLSDPQVIQTLLSRATPEDLNEQKTSFIAAAATLLEVSRRVNHRRERMFLKPSTVGAFSCYIAAAEAQLYRVTHDDRYLRSVSDLFSQSHFASMQPASLKVGLLNPLLPCIDAYQLLESELAVFEPDKNALIERFVLPVWDRAEARLCDGDNGFFAMLRQGTALCYNNNKANSDVAYVIALLAHELRPFELQ